MKLGSTNEDLKNIAGMVNQLGTRTAGEGVRLAIHAYMWRQVENGREIDAILTHYDVKNVAFVLDTGHVTLADIDPVALAIKLRHRIVEFHLNLKTAVHPSQPRPAPMSTPPRAVLRNNPLGEVRSSFARHNEIWPPALLRRSQPPGLG